jgi:hypothetical protein
VADGDISQYHYIRNRVTLKQIAVFLSYRLNKKEAELAAFKEQNGNY